MLAGPESDKAGPLGLLTIVLLGIAVYFLYRSMARHIKKVPASFDPPPAVPPNDERPGGGPAAPGAAPVPGATAEQPGAGAPAEPGPGERPTRPPAEP